MNFSELAKLPEIAAALKEKKLPAVSDLYRSFIAEMQAYAVAKNKTLRVWEGFGPSRGQSGHKPVPASPVAVPTKGLSVAIFGECTTL